MGLQELPLPQTGGLFILYFYLHFYFVKRSGRPSRIGPNHNQDRGFAVSEGTCKDPSDSPP